MKFFRLCAAGILLVTLASGASAQQKGATLQGKIINSATLKPVTTALIIIQEAGIVGNTKQDGSYIITLQKGGNIRSKSRRRGCSRL